MSRHDFNSDVSKSGDSKIGEQGRLGEELVRQEEKPHIFSDNYQGSKMQIF